MWKALVRRLKVRGVSCGEGVGGVGGGDGLAAVEEPAEGEACEDDQG